MAKAALLKQDLVLHMHMQWIGFLNECIQLCNKALTLYHIRRNSLSCVGRCKHLEKSNLRTGMPSCLKSQRYSSTWYLHSSSITSGTNREYFCLSASCFMFQFYLKPDNVHLSSTDIIKSGTFCCLPCEL